MAASLRQSYRACRRVTAEASSTFSLASLLFRRTIRKDIQALYAFCRVADDVADSIALSVASKKTQIRAMRQAITRRKLPLIAPDIWPAVWQVADRYALPEEELLEVLSGVGSDIEFTQPRTLRDLDRYSYYVAGVVGVLSARILGVTHKKGFCAAKNLGIAMQYTNVIRDVISDTSLKRTYIPVSLMKKYGIKQVDDMEASQALQAALAELCARAEDFYRKAKLGLAYLPAQHRKPVLVAYWLYHGILERVKQKQYNISTGRVRLSRYDKLQVVWRVYTGQ